MNGVFADTFYFLALLNKTDEAHEIAERFATARSGRLTTSTWILTELADGLAGTIGRTIFGALLQELENDKDTQIVTVDQDIWRNGVDLYDKRPDKQWSLTDCISFVVMNDLGISEALTADHHFEQAGFKALLK